MANLTQIELPNGITYDIEDAKKSGIYTVIGTHTTAVQTWTGAIDVPALYDGLTIMYYLPYRASSGNATLNLTLSDGTTTGAINCYYNASRLTTHYPAGSNFVMTYYSAGSISISGTATTDNRWVANADYDSDSYTKQTLQTDNTNRPLLLSYANNSNTSTNVTNITYRNNSIYANANKGILHTNVIQYEGNWVPIQTGATKQLHITFQTLMDWLITTKKYIPSEVNCHVWINATWTYADNDILQFNAHGIDYECQLAGCTMEFIGFASAYDTGVFRFIIHSSPAQSFTAASGYTKMPVSSIAEYWCNGSTYNPVWKLYSFGGHTVLKDVPSNAVFTDTKNTAGSTDTSSKIFLIGATSQAANPQTYSDNEVYATSGVLTTKSVQVGGGSCTMQYNTTTQSCDFVFT